MNKKTAALLAASLGSLAISACHTGEALQPESPPCAAHWLESVDRQLSIGDAQGHGPDIGSLEWRSAVEFKLGVRDEEGVPTRDSEQWCLFVRETLSSLNN